MLRENCTLSPNLLSFVVARMCSIIKSGEKGHKLPEQILFNFLVLFPTLSTVILLPSADLFEKGCCQLQAKVCARITG